MRPLGLDFAAMSLPSSASLMKLGWRQSPRLLRPFHKLNRLYWLVTTCNCSPLCSAESKWTGRFSVWEVCMPPSQKVPWRVSKISATLKQYWMVSDTVHDVYVTLHTCILYICNACHHTMIDAGVYLSMLHRRVDLEDHIRRHIQSIVQSIATNCRTFWPRILSIVYSFVCRWRLHGWNVLQSVAIDWLILLCISSSRSILQLSQHSNEPLRYH